MAHICHTQLKYKEAQDFTVIYSKIKLDVNYFNISHRDRAVCIEVYSKNTLLA